MRLFTAVALLLATLAVAPAPQSSPEPAQPAIDAARYVYAAFIDYERSVYAPYCAQHQGPLKVSLSTDKAWPATITCKDGYSVTVVTPK